MDSSSGLSAAEAYLLLRLPRWDARQALKLGFMGLLAQGVLRLEIEDRQGFIRTRHVPHLHVAPNLAEPLPPVAAALVAAVRGAAPDSRINAVLGQCERRFRRTLAGFVLDCLGPALAAHGLAEPYRPRLLGLVPVDGFRRTAAGDAAKERLEGLLRDARDIPRYIDSAPARAAALVTALGGAVLLVDALKPHYPALERALRQSGGGDGSAVPPFDDGVGDAHFGCFSGIDFSCLDGAAFDSFDAGFADAGGDGGGDGGSSGC